MVFTVWQLNRSFTHQIKEKCPTLQPTKQPYRTRTAEVTGGVFANIWQREYRSYTWKSLCHLVCPNDSSSHFCLNISICPWQQSQVAAAVEWWGLCDAFRSEKTYLLCVCVLTLVCCCSCCLEKSPQWSALPGETSVSFPPENSLPACKWKILTGSTVNWCWLCNYIF